MNTIAKSARRVWKSAQLYIGFYRDPKGEMRNTPRVWPPKNARATIHEDTQEQETFLVVKAVNGDGAQDVQIKLRPDMIVLRRNFPDAWQGVIVDEYAVAVKVGGISIRINHDGSITREDGDGKTWV